MNEYIRLMNDRRLVLGEEGGGLNANSNFAPRGLTSVATRFPFSSTLHSDSNILLQLYNKPLLRSVPCQTSLRRALLLTIATSDPLHYAHRAAGVSFVDRRRTTEPNPRATYKFNASYIILPEG